MSRFFPALGRMVAGQEIARQFKDIALAGCYHPLRRSGIMVTRSLFGFEAQAKMTMVAGEGLERLLTALLRRIYIMHLR